MEIYPLVPAWTDAPWGGTRLYAYGKGKAGVRMAESWEVSCHPIGPARLPDGQLLKDVLKPADIGDAFTDSIFPVLTKFIDARENLSVQVHPDDAFAAKTEGQRGKTEMWYILEAAEGAGIYLGPEKAVTKKELSAAIQEDRLMPLLHFQPVKPGEAYLIPAGTLHAIGAGVVLYEIQENSDVTYRVYDYGRGRELHLEKAMAVVSTIPVALDCRLHSDADGVLISCPYFRVRHLIVRGSMILPLTRRSFLGLTVVEGNGSVSALPAEKGQSFFCPARDDNLSLAGNMEILTVELP